MRNILLNDGTYIYSEDTLREHLESLGYDIDSLREALCDDIIADKEWYEDQYKAAEKESTGYFEHLNGLINEVIDIADNLASGKGGTKAQYAERFKKICDFYYC